jgi:hypothetical protein
MEHDDLSMIMHVEGFPINERFIKFVENLKNATRRAEKNWCKEQGKNLKKKGMNWKKDLIEK